MTEYRYRKEGTMSDTLAGGSVAERALSVAVDNEGNVLKDRFNVFGGKRKVVQKMDEIDPNQHPLEWMLWAVQDENAGLHRSNALLTERQRIMQCNQCGGRGKHRGSANIGIKDTTCQACNGTGSRIIQLEREAAQWKSKYETAESMMECMENGNQNLKEQVEILKVEALADRRRCRDLGQELRAWKKSPIDQNAKEVRKKRAKKQSAK